MDLDRSTVDHLLSTTRAVRKRLDLTRPVPHDVIVECLRLAIQAPTGSNAQRWRWIVVTDPDTRSVIAELYRNPRRGDVPSTEPPVELTAQQRRVMELGAVSHRARARGARAHRAVHRGTRRGGRLGTVDLSGGLEPAARAAESRARLVHHHRAPVPEGRSRRSCSAFPTASCRRASSRSRTTRVTISGPRCAVRSRRSPTGTAGATRSE